MSAASSTPSNPFAAPAATPILNLFLTAALWLSKRFVHDGHALAWAVSPRASRKILLANVSASHGSGRCGRTPEGCTAPSGSWPRVSLAPGSLTVVDLDARLIFSPAAPSRFFIIRKNRLFDQLPLGVVGVARHRHSPPFWRGPAGQSRRRDRHAKSARRIGRLVDLTRGGGTRRAGGADPYRAVSARRKPHAQRRRRQQRRSPPMPPACRRLSWSRFWPRFPPGTTQDAEARRCRVLVNLSLTLILMRPLAQNVGIALATSAAGWSTRSASSAHSSGAAIPRPAGEAQSGDDGRRASSVAASMGGAAPWRMQHAQPPGASRARGIRPCHPRPRRRRLAASARAGTPATSLTAIPQARPTADQNPMNRIFSGVPADRQPASRELSRCDPQLGRVAEEFNCIFCHRRPACADPVPQDPAALRARDARGRAPTYVATSIDPEGCIIFRSRRWSRPMPNWPGCSPA